MWRRMNEEQKKPYYQMAKKVREQKARDQKYVPKDRRRRVSDESLSGSCTDVAATRSSSQKTIRPRTAASTRSLNRSRSRPRL
nr:unnamed protein product [Callosobruchus analis]